MVYSPLQKSSRLIAPQTPNLIHGNSQVRITAITPQSLSLNTSLPIPSQLAQNKSISPHLKTPIASQISFKIQNHNLH